MSPIATIDIELQSIFRFGFDYIVAHPEVLDEIFSNFKEGHLWKLYGDAEIGKIKQWITENRVPVVLAWSLTPQKIPCISIHLAAASEDVPHAFMGDHAGLVETERTPRVIITPFVPDAYDMPTGLITVPDAIDLSLVRINHIVKDAKNEKYLITDVQPHTITIDTTGAPMDTKSIQVQSFIETDISKRGETYIQESVDIGVHGHADQNTVLWLYYMVLWIMMRFKSEVENRCIDLTTFSASDFKRDSMYIGENVFSRWIRLSARTRLSWVETPYDGHQEYSQVDTIVTDVNFDGELNSDGEPDDQ